jgi:hypothetical protein
VLIDFYAVAAQLSFVLLGLWWVVVQFRHDTMLSTPAGRRRAYQVSLYFLLPGLMSLASLASERLTVLWQIGFGAAGLIGVIVTATGMRATDGAGSRWADVTALVLYGLITIVAVAPTLPSSLGLDLKGREVEALAITLLLFLGTNLAWRAFVGSRAQEPSGSGETA